MKAASGLDLLKSLGSGVLPPGVESRVSKGTSLDRLGFAELLSKARAGAIPNFTGVSDPYEPPLAPEVVCSTGVESIEESARRVLAYLEARELAPVGAAAKVE